MRIQTLIEKISNKKVLVIGDHCVDIDFKGWYKGQFSREVYGKPIFSDSDHWISGGGAANIVDMLWGIGFEQIKAIGVWDPDKDDLCSPMLLRHFRARGIDVSGMVEGSPTPGFLKCYFPTGEHEFRMNISSRELSSDIHSKLCQNVQDSLDNDFVIFADYNEEKNGVLSTGLLDALNGISGIRIGHSRERSQSLYGFDYMIVNQQEQKDFTDDWRNHTKNLIVTGEGLGCILYKDDEIIEVDSLPVVGRFDTCGCGDAFIGGFILGLCLNQGEEEALRWANAAGAAEATKLYGARDISLANVISEYERIYG